MIYEPPPDLRNRPQSTHPLSNTKAIPPWWKKVYSRNAKKITAATWKDLLQDTTIEEVKQTVQNCKKNKAAGHDGVDTNLLQMLTSSNGPLAEILSILINVSFARGKTLPSWRKAVITLIPKRKDDGSLTDSLKEMRPISVLQEFGKIASKILAERWGAYPSQASLDYDFGAKSLSKGWECSSMYRYCAQCIRGFSRKKANRQAAFCTLI